MSTPEQKAQRQLQICNACRYCEGFCAMFPAMTRRLSFEPADVHYLANLCHNCGACLHACQYAPPHEFRVNIPQSLAKVRRKTYSDYAWPRALGVLYQRNGLVLALALAISLSLMIRLISTLQTTNGTVFYDLLSHTGMVALFAPVFLFACLALGLGVRAFLRDVKPATSGAPVQWQSAREASQAALTLQYLDGGHGQGCNNEDDAFGHARRYAHHLTFYGFMLCFAATSVATLLHYFFNASAPYDWPTLPKLLGVSGGISLLLGCMSLMVLHLRRHPDHGDADQKGMDLGFIALLALVSASGLGLWLSRQHAFMPLWLCLHLGSVMALFATLPYSKFAHGIFRLASLIRFSVEKRQPNTLGLGSD
jgi:citrate/tricarballylate utilization protein